MLLAPRDQYLLVALEAITLLTDPCRKLLSLLTAGLRHGGQDLADLAAGQIFERPGDPYTRALMDAAFELRATEGVVAD